MDYNKTQEQVVGKRKTEEDKRKKLCVIKELIEKDQLSSSNVCVL